MNGDLRDQRIRLLMTGTVSLVADQHGIDRWHVDGQPAIGDQLAALAGTTRGDVVEVELLVGLRGEMARDESDATLRDIKALIPAAVANVVARARAALDAHPDAGSDLA